MAVSNQTGIQVQLNGVHLCCGGCVNAVTRAVARVPGVACPCDMDEGTVTLAAPDHAKAEKALDAIAAAGLPGETGDGHLAMKAQHDVPAGKLHKATVSDIHNCCDPCAEAIQEAIRSVAGVTGDTVEPGKTRFEVTGSFAAADLLRALNAAGFHARVKDAEAAQSCRCCGRPTSVHFGGMPICEECYQHAGSCCLEFGGDDLWQKREEALQGGQPDSSGGA